MIIIIVLAAITALGVALLKVRPDWFIGYITTLWGGGLLLISVVTIPFERMKSRGFMFKYESVRSTVDQARSGEISDIERAAIQNKIIETNSELASLQYWNTTILDIWHVDDVMDLKPIK